MPYVNGPPHPGCDRDPVLAFEIILRSVRPRRVRCSMKRNRHRRRFRRDLSPAAIVTSLTAQRWRSATRSPNSWEVDRLSEDRAEIIEADTLTEDDGARRCSRLSSADGTDEPRAKTEDILPV